MSSNEISSQQKENDDYVENNVLEEELEKLGICKAQTSESIERKIELLVEEQTHKEELFHNNAKRVENESIELNTEIKKEKEPDIQIKDDVDDNPDISEPDNFNTLLNASDYKLQETLLEKNIRTGEMTPFGNELGRNTSKLNPELSAFEKYLKRQVELTKAKQKKKISKKPLSSLPSTSNYKEKDLLRKSKKCTDPTPSLSPWKELPEIIKEDEDSEYLPSETDSSCDDNKNSKKRKYTNKKSNVKLKRKQTKRENKESDESDWTSSGDEKKLRRRQKRSANVRVLDDGNIADYDMRIKMWKESKDVEVEEFHEIEGDYRIAKSIWNKLFKYQKVGVQWLWELHQQRCGGILGDEMGLGKTIQIIAFLAGLNSSNIRSKHSLYRGLGPSLIICPTTVMHQWVDEFHIWWPNFRVAILHDSGAFQGKRTDLIKQLFKNKNYSSGGPILITSYNGTLKHREILLQYDWHYVILDEGHKIRNPDAKITLNVKQFRTPHRLIVTGSPMQNNLKELWSLMDFVFPGKLATLPVFTAELAVPIIQGGYTNATQFQVATAYKCALILKDTISPYLLRRNKSDVKSHINLPGKNEQVLFCRLTPHQTQLYKDYLNAAPVADILQGRGLPFVALNTLRKICNHPDLHSGGTKIFKDTIVEDMAIEERFGYWEKSGKMVVIDALLKIWKRQGHRVLLFAQGVKILRILENYVKSRNYSYLTLDGTTAISQRQPLINKFNEDSNIFVFLLTTRVGGLGVNLTGANRVVIFDPDWNPATDCQARERAWRIGQRKEVTIYRLITAGTIEEKMYHRQIFKQFLSNKVLKDPRQRRFFKSNDLFELFTLKEYEDEANTETGAIFAGTSSEIRIKDKIKEKYRKPIAPVSKKIEFSNEKLIQMRLLAQNISLQISNKTISPMDISKNTNLKTTDKTSKEKKRKRKWKSFEGEEIPLLVAKKSKKSVNEEEESIQRPKEQDDYVLRKLFKKTGLQTALRHDVIMHGVGEGGDADLDIVEGEAKRVAKEALEALKESSRNECWQAQTGRVTWTGNNGNIRRRKTSSTITSEQTNIENKSNNYISEDQLLNMIQKRNMLSVQPNNKFRPPKPSHLQLLTDIRNFLVQGGGGGSATTKELIDEFSSRLPPSETPLFKCLLEEICTFTRTASGEGLWTLRENLEEGT